MCKLFGLYLTHSVIAHKEKIEFVLWQTWGEGTSLSCDVSVSKNTLII